MEILAKRLHPDAIVPVYANDGDAGCDLVAVESCTIRAGGGRALVATGIAVAIPEGHGGFVLPRSGLAWRHGVTLANAPGLIDAGYRGEVKVALVNLDSDHDYEVQKGDRIAQLVVMAVASSAVLVVDELPSTSRGEGGFGSSGR
ncbi:MAG TPA: dUTP diphosphatase [Acidimicrobiales bacterium]|jgi:dUTP pyrophosphatase|nr:dUTP diphosphatase [Acidimicrobiales bacterium]